MRGWRRPALAWLALAVYLLPASAFAQATKAGVVTTLEGNVTAVRAVAPQPVALKFKDDVYLQDRVVTGEQSFARLLLGGKAVVSIRERSAVTITEIPGRSTIDVESGKIALSVARDRMQPGEVISIKMPNAVAGVRGTVVIAEVSYALVGGAQQAISNLAVLRGQVEAVHTNAAGVAIGTPVMVGAMQKFSATPTTASTGTFTVEQIGGIVQGLQSKGAADPGTASQAPARLEAVNTAVALLTALTGTSGSQAVQQLATGTSPEITTPSDTQPVAKITEAGDTSLSPVVPGGSPLSQLTQLPPAPPPPMNMTSLPSGQSLLTFTGSEVQSSDGTPIVPTTDPLLSQTGFTISQQGSDDLVVAKSDANVALPGPLLKLTNTSVQAGDAFLSVAGHITSTSSQPFINLDPTMVMAPGNLIEVVGPSGVLGLAGTLVQDTGGTIGAGGSIVSVSQGGTLTSTGQGALVQFNGTTATASSLLSVVGSGSSATLSGTLFAAQGGSLTIPGIALADISNGGRVTSTSTQPFVNIVGTALALPETTFVVSGGQLTVGGSLLRAESLPAMTSFGLLVDNGGVVTVGGPVFDVVNSIAGARIVLANGSVLTSQGGPLVRIAGLSASGPFTGLLASDTLVTTDGTGNGLTLRGPVLDGSNAIVTLARLYGPGPFDAVALRLNPGDPVVRLDSSIMVVSAPNEPFLSRGAAAGQDRTQAGVSLIETGTSATPSALVFSGSLLRLGNVELSDLAPQIQISNSSAVYAGTDPAVRVIDVAGPATTSASLVSLVNGTIDVVIQGQPVTPGQLASNASLIGVRGGLTTGQAPLVVVDGSTSAIAGVQRVLSVEPTGALALGGSALSLVNGNVTAGTILGFDAPVTTAAAAALAVSGGTLVASDGLLAATRNLGIGGGLLAQSGGSVVTGGAAVASITGAAFSSSPSAVFQLTGGSLSAPGLVGGDLLRASAATVSLGGALLSSENAAVSLAGAVATLNNGSHLIQEAGPFVSVHGGSFSAGALLRADGTGNTFAFTGTVLDLTDTTARLGLIADFPDLGTNGATLLLAPGEPAARVTRSTLRIDRGPFVTLVSAAETGCSPCGGVGTFSGVALIGTGTAATPSSITVADELVALGTVDFVGADPITQLTRTTVQQTGDGSAFISWFPDVTFGTRSTTKPLLVATDSNLDVPGRAILQFGGARLVAAINGTPFLSLTNTAVNAGWLVDAQSGQLEVAGPLAAFNGGNSTIGGALLRILGGAAVITSAATATASIAGGTHQFGWVFQLDNGGVTEDQVVTGFGASPDVTLHLGTTQPLRQDSGVLQAPLLSASNATIDAATGLRLDTVRLDTFSRLFDFTNSTVTGGSLGFIDLARSARLVANIPDAGLVNLFHSSMTLSGSALARVRGTPPTGGSLLQIGMPTAASSLVSLAGGSTLALLTNAPLLSVTDGSAAQIFGSLISFVGTGNTVTVDNNLCLAFICATVNGVRIARGASVLLSSIRIETDPISGLAGNTLTVGDDDALILIDGANSRLLIAGTGADVPDVVLDDTFVALSAGQTLKTFSGISTRSGTSPVIFIRDSLVDGPDATLVVADPTANAILQAGPLMKITNSSLEVARLLLVQGTLISRGASPLIALDPVTINAQTLVEIAASGNLSLAGPLLTDLSGTISTKQDAIIVAGSLMSTGAAALVGLQGTTLNVGTAASQANLFKITGLVSLGGPLLSATGATVRTTGDAVGVFDGGQLAQAGGAALLLLSNSSLTAGNASLARLLNVSGVGGTSGQTPSTAVIMGSLLDATNSVVTTTGNGVGVFGGALFSSLGAPLFMLNGSSLTTGPGAPVNELDGALLNMSGVAANGVPSTVTLQAAFVSAFGDSTITTRGNVMQIAGGTIFLGLGGGPLIQTVDSRLATSFDVLAAYNASIVRLGGPLLNVIGGSLDVGRRVVGVFDGSDVSAVAGDALVSLVNGNHVLGRDPGSAAFMVGDAGSRLTVPGGLLALNGATVTMFGPFLQIAASGALNGAGPLLDMTGGTLSSNTTNAFIGVTGSTATPGALTAQQFMRLTAAANLVLRGSLVSTLDTSLTATDSNRGAFAIDNGAILSTTATASPLFSFNGSVFGSSQVTVARQLLELSGTPASSINLSGPLMAATNTMIRTGDPTKNPFGLVFVGDSATFTSTTSAPLLSLVNSTADLAGAIVSVRRSTSIASPTSMTLSGPMIFASGSSITTTSLGFDAFFGTTGQTCCSVVSIRQGARLTTTADVPLIQLASSTLNDGPDARSGGTIFNLQDSLVGTTGELVAPATANLAGQLLTATNSNISALFNIITITNSTLTSTTTSPLVALSGGSLTLGGANPLAAGALTFARGLSLSGAGAVLSLQGPLFAFSSMNATITGELLGVFNSSLLTDTTTQPLIQLSGGTFTTGPTANFMSIASSAGLSPSMQLAGPLISATNATLRNGDPTTFVPQTLSTLHAFTFIGDSAQVRSTSTEPLFDFNGVSLTSSAGVMSLRRSLTTASPTRLTLDGPLLRAVGNTSIDVTSLALGTPCCAAFDVEQAAQLVSTTTAALIQVDASRINAGPDAQSGGTLFLVSDSGLADGPIVASPARVTLNGPLISSVNSKLSSLFSLVGVGRSTLTSTSLDPLIQLTGFKDDLALQLGGVDPFVALPNNQTRTGRVLNVVASATTATVGDAALVSLAGPLLSAVSAPIQLTGDVIGVFNGAKVDSTSTLPFVRLSGEATALVAGAIDPGSNTVVDGRLLLVSGIGGPDGVTPASLTLSGPLLRQEAGSIVDTNSRGLTLLTDGALVTRAPPIDTTYPLLQVNASSLSVGSTSRTGVLLEVTGSGALAADPQTNPLTGGPSGLQFGQQRPLQHNGRGALLEASNSAFVNIRGANGTLLRLDTALLDATAPIFLLTTAARVQTSGNGIDLVRNARLQASNASDAVVRIDSQARMDVLNGHLASVSASRLNVAGDLVRMGTNSLLNVTNGVLLSVLNGGIANINGALVSFTGLNGMINITNTLAPTTFIAGIPVNVAPGGNIAIGQGALAGLNVNGNTIRINGTALPTGANANSGITGSLISVGANGTVRVGGGLN